MHDLLDGDWDWDAHFVIYVQSYNKPTDEVVPSSRSRGFYELTIIQEVM